jgi:pyridoxine kinase
MSRAAIISISSHVARGSVGNRAMSFALERLGFEVWAVPTIILPHHPGRGPAEKIVPNDNRFAAIVEALVEGGRAKDVVGMVSGYFASAAQVGAVGALVRAVKAARPGALYLCDPVIGDQGGLYVDAAIAAAIRDELLPLAEAATPNAFECAWLADEAPRLAHEFAVLARRLAPPVVLVTSVPAMMRGQTGNLLVTESETMLFEHPLLSTPVKGTGDLLAALLLGRRLQGLGWPAAAERALGSVFEILSGTVQAGGDQLMLAALQGSIVEPRAVIDRRGIGSATRA